MRELKFRIWDNDKNEWLAESDDNALTYYGFHLIGEVMTVQSPTKWRVNGVVEQYTGLKDKNGEEIYEGDIVATVYKTKCRTDEDVFGEGHDEWDEKIKGKFEVKYSRRATFGISYVKDPVVIRDLWELGSDIKVIGNIHENPELLEEE